MRTQWQTVGRSLQQEALLAGWTSAHPWDGQDLNHLQQRKERQERRGAFKEEPQVSILASLAWARFVKPTRAWESCESYSKGNPEPTL